MRKGIEWKTISKKKNFGNFNFTSKIWCAQVIKHVLISCIFCFVALKFLLLNSNVKLNTTSRQLIQWVHDSSFFLQYSYVKIWEKKGEYTIHIKRRRKKGEYTYKRKEEGSETWSRKLRRRWFEEDDLWDFGPSVSQSFPAILSPPRAVTD